jgi:putative spermidine/putrescine transport system permease protein
MLGIFLLFLLLPIFAVALNAFGEDWSGSVLPVGYTDRWAAKVAGDPEFQQAVLNSLLLALGTLFFATLICVPAVLVAHCYFPWLDRLLGALVIVPYSVPGIVLALGLLRLYSGNYGIQLNGTPWVLVFAYIPLGASFFYVPIKANLRAIPVTDIFEAGYLVGASDLSIMLRIILPSILRGLVVGLAMNFTLVISEFVYSNLLVGSFYPTLQIYLQKINSGSGHLSSVVVAAYFLIVLIATTIVAMALMPRKETP